MQSSEGLSVYRNIYTCKILHIDQISENKLFTFHSDAQEQRERQQFGVIFRHSRTNPKRTKRRGWPYRRLQGITLRFVPSKSRDKAHDTPLHCILLRVGALCPFRVKDI